MGKRIALSMSSFLIVCIFCLLPSSVFGIGLEKDVPRSFINQNGIPNSITFYVYSSEIAETPVASETFLSENHEWTADFSFKRYSLKFPGIEVVRFKVNFTNDLPTGIEYWLEIELDGILVDGRELQLFGPQKPVETMTRLQVYQDTEIWNIPSGFSQMYGNHIVFDTLNEWDIDERKFVAKTSGYYNISAQVYLDLSFSSARFSWVRLMVDSNNVNARIVNATYYPDNQNINDASVVVDKLVYLNTGDYLYFSGSANTVSGESYEIDAGINYSFISIHRLP